MCNSHAVSQYPGNISCATCNIWLYLRSNFVLYAPFSLFSDSYDHFCRSFAHPTPIRTTQVLKAKSPNAASLKDSHSAQMVPVWPIFLLHTPCI